MYQKNKSKAQKTQSSKGHRNWNWTKPSSTPGFEIEDDTNTLRNQRHWKLNWHNLDLSTISVRYWVGSGYLSLLLNSYHIKHLIIIIWSLPFLVVISYSCHGFLTQEMRHFGTHDKKKLIHMQSHYHQKHKKQLHRFTQLPSVWTAKEFWHTNTYRGVWPKQRFSRIISLEPTANSTANI